jgi:GT2 family glycosyltransferase
MAKTSIIIPVIYRADLMEVLLDSVFKYTEGDFEVIVVQEGEDQVITDLLKSYGEKITFAQNKTAKGFAGAMNTGLALAKGDYFCFLNSDTVAVRGWLEEMLKAFDDKEVGLVTPTFGATESHQHVDWNKGQTFDYVDDPLSLMGVCFVISKVCMDKVGIWDESFGLGGGDDNDMCLRVSKAGFKLVIARKAYIYHYGSASFREVFNNDADESKKFAVSQFNKFREKHSMDNTPSIYIAVLCVEGTLRYELAMTLMNWLGQQQQGGYKMEVHFINNLVPHDNARNTAVKNFLEGYCSHLMFIDDDIIPHPATLTELIKADKDAIAPLCFQMRLGDGGIWAPMPVAHRYDGKKEYRPYYGNGVEEVDAMTGGCSLVRRKVYEAIERPYFFIYHKNGTAIYSEDFVFSQQCQEKGFKLFTDYRLTCGHYKTLNILDINNLAGFISGQQKAKTE